jgi:proline iminopeptidase
MNLTDNEFMLELNGVRHWVRVAGAIHDTMPLVVVHGGPGGMVYTLEHTIGPRLESFCTVVYYEQRGSGRSEAALDKDSYTVAQLIADLEALRLVLNLDRINLFGFSFGAELALEYAAAHPNAVHRVVASSPGSIFGSRVQTVQLNNFENVAQGEVLEQIRGIRDLLISTGNQLDRIWQIVDAPTVDRLLFQDADAAERTRANWEEFDQRFTASIDMGEHFEWINRSSRHASEVLPEVQASTLVTCGLFDRNSGVDINRDVAALIPNSSFVLFEHSAHFPEIEEPERFESVIKTFLEM